MSEFRDPLGRTFFESKQGDDIAIEVAPGQHVCDFCMTAPPTWEYPCGWVTLTANAVFGASDDEWAACDACHDLIEAGDLDALVNHLVELAQRAIKDMPGRVVQPEALRINLEGFFEAREGPPRPFDPSTGPGATP